METEEEEEEENTTTTTTSSEGRSKVDVERVEDTSRERRGLELQRSKTKAAAGTVKNLLTRFAKENSGKQPVGRDDSEEILLGQTKESETDSVRSSNQSSKYQSRASIKAAPGTVRNLRANFEKK